MLLTACNGLPWLRPLREARFTPTGPTVVAFTAALDPVRDPRDADTYAASIHSMRGALSELAACAELASGEVHLILADRVYAAYPEGEIEIDGAPAGVIILMDAQQPPSRIDLSLPSGSPNEILREAAAYYRAPECLAAAGVPPERSVLHPGKPR